MSLTTKEVCICDQCGIERNKDTNHWWLAWQYCDSLVTAFRPWNDCVAAAKGTIHLCGLTCLYKAIDKLAQEILEQERVKA